MNNTLVKCVYAVLADVCGAPTDEMSKLRFELEYGSDRPTSQYRFEGNFGHGGKFMFPAFTVSYYTEHLTPEREAARIRANTLLAALRVEYLNELYAQS